MAKQKEKYENKAYRLTGNQYPLSYMLASRHSSRSPLLHFDDEQGINRPLRYARNQRSPFEDEQDGNAILEPIVFEDGMLMVEKQNQVLQQFLHYHPSNGMVFEEINNSRDASLELEYVEAELNAQIEAKKITTDVNKLTSVCRVLMGNGIDNMTIPELKRVSSFPDDFKLLGDYKQNWERIGRAVPPNMMKAIAEHIRYCILDKINNISNDYKPSYYDEEAEKTGQMGFDFGDDFKKGFKQYK